MASKFDLPVASFPEFSFKTSVNDGMAIILKLKFQNIVMSKMWLSLGDGLDEECELENVVSVVKQQDTKTVFASLIGNRLYIKYDHEKQIFEIKSELSDECHSAMKVPLDDYNRDKVVEFLSEIITFRDDHYD